MQRASVLFLAAKHRFYRFDRPVTHAVPVHVITLFFRQISHIAAFGFIFIITTKILLDLLKALHENVLAHGAARHILAQSAGASRAWVKTGDNGKGKQHDQGNHFLHNHNPPLTLDHAGKLLPNGLKNNVT